MILIDVQAVAFLQDVLLGSFGTPFFIFSARWLILAVLGMSVLAFLCEREPNHRHAWKETAWASLLAFVASLVISYALQRVRPYEGAPDLVRLIVAAPSSAFSFPSAHAAAIWAWAGSVSLLERRAAPLWVAVAVLVSLGRVAVGVHHLSDVVAGAVLGLACVLFVRRGHHVLRCSSLSV